MLQLQRRSPGICTPARPLPQDGNANRLRGWLIQTWRIEGPRMEDEDGGRRFASAGGVGPSGFGLDRPGTAWAGEVVAPLRLAG